MISRPIYGDVPQAPAGAGIQMRPLSMNTADREAHLKSLPRYVFSAGEDFSLADRLLGINSLFQGRLTYVDNFTHDTQNLTDEYIVKGVGSPIIQYTKSAYDCADEITGAFTTNGTQSVFAIPSLTGQRAEWVRQFESIALPDAEFPRTLKRLVSYLSEKAQENLLASGMSGEELAVAQNALGEMTESAQKTYTFQVRYLDRTEREMINSRKPNGTGKSSLDDRDRHFYRMTERPMPVEADLERVADGEGKTANDTALASAIKMLADKVGTPASTTAEPDRISGLEAQIAELTKLVADSVKSSKSTKTAPQE